MKQKRCGKLQQNESNVNMIHKISSYCTSTLYSASANMSAPILDPTKITTGGIKCFPSETKSNSLFFFDLSSTHNIICFTNLLGVLGGPTDKKIGLDNISVASFSIGCGIVAENIIFWQDVGMLLVILFT